MQVGLGLSYALTITRTLSYGIRSSTALENEFNSVERVQEFIGLDQEEEDDVSGGISRVLLRVGRLPRCGGPFFFYRRFTLRAGR